jgi:hypothetical protein
MKLILRIKLAYHVTMAWHYNRIAAKASQDLLYSDQKSKASKVLREYGIRSNIHEAHTVALKAMIAVK